MNSFSLKRPMRNHFVNELQILEHTACVPTVGGVMLGDQVSQSKWRDFAACRGPQAHNFFSFSSSERRDERRRREAQAKKICNRCDVCEECLSHALEIRELYGIWGGTNGMERRAMLGLYTSAKNQSK